MNYSGTRPARGPMLPASALRFCRIPEAHAELVRMRQAHAVAAVVEEATGQNGGRAPEPDGVGGALGLHGLEQIAVIQTRTLWKSNLSAPIAA
jgi:hypothetical protein